MKCLFLDCDKDAVTTLELKTQKYNVYLIEMPVCILHSQKIIQVICSVLKPLNENEKEQVSISELR